jgi:hypothetical protein
MELKERVLHEIVGHRAVAALREAANLRCERGIGSVERIEVAVEVAPHQPAQFGLRHAERVCLLLHGLRDPSWRLPDHLLLNEQPNCDPVML